MASEFVAKRVHRTTELPAAWERMGMLGILLLGFGIRLIRLGADSMWYDEAVSLFLASKSLPEMIAHTAGDIHPPLYYALLHFWTAIAGSSEFAAGFFSVLFGVSLIPLTYYLGKQIFNSSAGLLGAFLIAISPFNIWYSQEVRMYTLGAALGLVALVGMRWGLQPEKRKWMGWVVYALAVAAGMYVLYYFAFLLIAINIWALIIIFQHRSERRNGMLWRWAGAQVAAALLYAPWVPILIRQAIHPPVPPWRSFTPIHKALIEVWTALGFGQSVEPAQVWPLLILAFVLIAAGAWRLWREIWTDSFLLLGYWLIPLGLILLFSLWTPLYHVRYLFTYSPAFYLLMAIGLLAIGRRWRVVGIFAAIALVAGSVFSLWQYHAAPAYWPDDHRGAVHYLTDHWQPGDAVLINAGYVYPAFVYYNQLPVGWRGRLSEYEDAFTRQQDPDALVLLQTGSIDGPAGLGWGSPDSDFYAISWEETARKLEQLFTDYDRVWVYRCYDTVTDPDGLIRSWLDAHGIKFDEPPAFAGQSYIRVQGYLPRRNIAPPPQATTLDARFGNRLKLTAVEGVPDTLPAGRPLNLVLWWMPVQAPLPRLAVTVRLVDGAGHVWTQTDEQPLGPQYDTTLWPAGQFVRHPLTLDVPAGLIPGAYRLVVGVYEAESSVPWLSDEGQPLVDIVTMHAPGDTLSDVRGIPLATFGNQIDLLDVTYRPAQVEAGRNIELDLIWHARQTPAEDLIVFVQLLDKKGNLVVAQESAPADGHFPTSAWSPGQVVRERRVLHVPADLPAGDYQLITGLYRLSSGERLAVGTFWPWEPKDYLKLGLVAVYSREPQRVMPFEPAHLSGETVADGIALAGYTVDTTKAYPGGRIGVILIWQAVGPIGRDYSVFCHLTDDAGKIWGQADGIPAGGTMSTMAWMAGEYVVDERVIPVAANAPAGDYRIVVGMYDSASGQRAGEPVDLGTVAITP